MPSISTSPSAAPPFAVDPDAVGASNEDCGKVLCSWSDSCVVVTACNAEEVARACCVGVDEALRAERGLTGEPTRGVLLMLELEPEGESGAGRFEEEGAAKGEVVGWTG